MKKLYTFLAAILLTATTFAQVPEKMSYQAVVRDASGALVSEQLVGIEIEILYSQYGGTAYIETHFVNTNANGLVTLEIGTGSTGNVFNDFSAIQWDTIDGNWIYTKIDPLGGVNYTITNISQLLSVPYALYAKNSATTPNLESVLSENNSANNQQIKDLQDPTEAQDAVTKNYTYSKDEVDALLANLQSQIDALDTTPVTDQDGNTYDKLYYGDQVWTVENAEMVTYRDGTPIPEVTDNAEWESLTTGAWSYYDNDPTKPRFYNWYAVMGIHDVASLTDESLRKEFAPDGWHVPSDAEWTTLEERLIANGYNYDGTTTTENRIAKAMASTSGWGSSTIAAAPGSDQSLNNDSGFNAFPEGYRQYDGSFYYEGNYAIFWSSTEYDTYDSNLAWHRFLYYDFSYLYRDYYSNKQRGLSVRFVRD